MNRIRVTRGLAAALLLAAGMSGLGGATPFGTIPSALAAYPVSFAPQTPYAVGSNPEGVAIGDFNGDGHPDLAVANVNNNNNDNTVSVLLGKADGTFGAQTTYAVGRGPAGVAIGDFNGDGHPDLAVTNEGSGTVSVLLGKGDGTFGAQTTYAVGSLPDGVVIGDFNGDGHPDLAVANYGSNTVSVLLGKGDGTFGAQTAYDVVGLPNGVAIGDFNGDGHPDLAVTNASSTTVYVLLGKGDGTFGAPTPYAVGSNPEGVAIGDFNADGHPDLAVTNEGSGTVSVLLGKGDGTFGAQTTYAVGANPFRVAIGDFNGDGHPDLAVVNSTYGSVSGTVSVLLGKGDGTFGAQTTYPVGNYPQDVAIGDFNGDGHPDLAVTNSNSNTVSVLLSTLTPTAARVSAAHATRQAGVLTLTWRVTHTRNIVGFDLYAGTLRLNAHLIPVHRFQSYAFHTRWSGAGPYTLHLILSNGTSISLPVH